MVNSSPLSTDGFSRGYSDHRDGKGFFDNPYPNETTEARRWVDGKVQAIIDERRATN